MTVLVFYVGRMDLIPSFLRACEPSFSSLLVRYCIVICNAKRRPTVFCCSEISFELFFKRDKRRPTVPLSRWYCK